MKSIKFIFYIISFLLFTTGSLLAQVDRSEPPKAGPAPEINLKDPATFTLDNGLEVIVAENHQLPRVSYQLSIDVNPVMEKNSKGYVSAAGSLLRNGTKNRSKSEIDEAVDFIGASLYTYTNGIYASCLTNHQEKLLDIVSDVLMNPTFPKEEVDKHKQQQVSSLNASKTNPTAIAGRVAQKVRYGENHPYGEVQTIESAKNITRDKLMEYYKTYYKPNTSYLVIVGDITPKKAKKYARKYFGDWKKKDVPEHKYDFPERNENTQVAMVNQDDAEQSVISITYPIKLKTGSKDAIPARVTNNILGGGVFSGYLMQNLREDKGYTYGARSTMSKDELAGYFKAGAEVGTQVTDSAITEFIKEMKRIRNEKVEEEHLNLVKNVISGSFARSLEKPRTFADFALNIMKYDLPADYYSNYLKKVEQVTPEDVQAIAQKYILPEQSTVLVVGSREKLSERLMQFDSDNTIAYYDAFGQEVKTSEAEAGMSAGKVIEKYIEARGGRENIKSIEEIVQIGNTNIHGNEVTVKTYRKAPDMKAQLTVVGGNVFQKQIYDGEEGKMVARGQEQKASGDQLENLKYEATMHKYLNYDTLNIKTKLKGVEEANGKKSYKIELEFPNGRKRTDYYSKENGLLVKRKMKQSSPRGEVTVIQEFSDYKEKAGVLFPYQIDISGMQNMTMKIEEIKINSGIKDETFE